MKKGLSESCDLLVGITYNLRKDVSAGPPDAEAEYDDLDTVLAVKEALEASGCRVELYEADGRLPARLSEAPPDIVFNIAEGRHGRGREAHVPAILSYLGVPYVGSDESAMCFALDKALTKRLLRTYRVRTPGYVLVRQGAPLPDAGRLKYPLIVKPNAEGSGKGISDVSVVEDAPGLHRAVEDSLRAYQQDLLVEEFIPGREFTVGLLGNGESLRVFTPMEVIFRDKSRSVYSYAVKKDFQRYVDYACPPNLSAGRLAGMKDTARKIYEAVGCRDFARVDFRLSPGGLLYFLEINPIPGLAPGYSDYPMLAGFSGMGYRELIQAILHSALARYGRSTSAAGVEA